MSLVEKYKLMGKKGEGTFSDVMKAVHVETGEFVAIKRMKSRFTSFEQVYNLREIQALKRLSPHPNIVHLAEVVFDQSKEELSLVFELMDCNLYELIKNKKSHLSEQQVKIFMYQLLKALYHMHKNGIFHRDIKPENLLVCGDVLKLADFGSCKGVYSKPPNTEYISTRWYRAPECLLTDGFYDHKMDIWGVGCVMFEIIGLFPLFPGSDELDQIYKIHNVLGTPPRDVLRKLKRRKAMRIQFPHKEGSGIAKHIPHASSDCVHLIQRMLAYCPEERISSRDALRHPFFRDLREADRRARMLALAAHSGMSSAASLASPSRSPRLSQQPPEHHQARLPRVSRAQEKGNASQKAGGNVQLPMIQAGATQAPREIRGEAATKAAPLPSIAAKSKVRQVAAPLPNNQRVHMVLSTDDLEVG
eukprot:TRINITY_DN8613_c0_g4_i2.p1 TRINITY_DN8613_c0_g4~~TRINITY_DN8613_c0_g4_i2.p1  ORF type:complete len:418 (+),score=64.97 TRINITY_DN8613_c0_g4_i2:134-1387(+)